MTKAMSLLDQIETCLHFFNEHGDVPEVERKKLELMASNEPPDSAQQLLRALSTMMLSDITTEELDGECGLEVSRWVEIVPRGDIGRVLCDVGELVSRLDAAASSTTCNFPLNEFDSAAHLTCERRRAEECARRILLRSSVGTHYLTLLPWFERLAQRRGLRLHEQFYDVNLWPKILAAPEADLKRVEDSMWTGVQIKSLDWPVACAVTHRMIQLSEAKVCRKTHADRIFNALMLMDEATYCRVKIGSELFLIPCNEEELYLYDRSVRKENFCPEFTACKKFFHLLEEGVGCPRHCEAYGRLRYKSHFTKTDADWSQLDLDENVCAYVRRALLYVAMTSDCSDWDLRRLERQNESIKAKSELSLPEFGDFDLPVAHALDEYRARYEHSANESAFRKINQWVEFVASGFGSRCDGEAYTSVIWAMFLNEPVAWRPGASVAFPVSVTRPLARALMHAARVSFAPEHVKERFHSYLRDTELSTTRSYRWTDPQDQCHTIPCGDEQDDYILKFTAQQNQHAFDLMRPWIKVVKSNRALRRKARLSDASTVMTESTAGVRRDCCELIVRGSVHKVWGGYERKTQLSVASELALLFKNHERSYATFTFDGQEIDLPISSGELEKFRAAHLGMTWTQKLRAALCTKRRTKR